MTYQHDWPAFQAALAKAELLMLDFDGPICSVFSGLPAPEVANRLRDKLRSTYPGPFPGLDDTGGDPFDVLAYARRYTPDAVPAVNALFARYECKAVQTAEPTPGAHALITRWAHTGRPLAIVSNNSADAVRAYLDLHNLAHSVNHVSARTSETVDKIKPSPHLLNTAMSALEVEPASAVFVGDSVTDMEAAAAARVLRLAFANKQGKRDALGLTSDVLIERFENQSWPSTSTMLPAPPTEP